MGNGGYSAPSLAEVRLRLREAGITAPADLPAVEAALRSAAEGRNTEVVAARGLAPKPGPDGYVEFLVDFGSPIPLNLFEGGQVAPMRSSLIRNVGRGQPLAVIHPPIPGEPGWDVFGKPLPCAPGKAAAQKLGINVVTAPHDPHLIIAAAEGHVRMQDGLLEVQDCLRIPGDVDNGTGNVSFAKSVMIAGDVKAGFSVEAGGDAEILGLVEDCLIRAEGKVFIQTGFAGQGKGLVQAKDEIWLGYVRNQPVKGGDRIVVGMEAVNSRLQARMAVIVKGHLAGGTARAGEFIECAVAGTENGAATLLEAGYDFEMAEEMEDIRAQMEKMARYSSKMEEGLEQVQDIEKLNRSLEPWTTELVFDMERMRAKVDAKLAILRHRLSGLEAGSAPTDRAKVIIHRQAYPGVMIRIGKHSMRLDEPLAGPMTFVLREEAIARLEGF